MIPIPPAHPDAPHTRSLRAAPAHAAPSAPRQDPAWESHAFEASRAAASAPSTAILFPMSSAHLGEALRLRTLAMPAQARLPAASTSTRSEQSTSRLAPSCLGPSSRPPSSPRSASCS